MRGGGGGPAAAGDLDPVRASAAPYDGRSPAVPGSGTVRVLVQLSRPSLGAVAARRERAGLRPLPARAQRRYVHSLLREARTLRSSRDAKGIRFTDVVPFARVLAGFAADVRARDVARVSTLGVRVDPVRRLFPVAAEAGIGTGAAPAATRPPRGARPVALLDSGVDARHPALRGAVHGGTDVVDGDRDPSPGSDGRRRGRLERHGTALAGVLAAAGAAVRPIRVAHFAPGDEGTNEESATTDRLLAGLERVVDGDGDGDAEDALPVAVTGLGSPYAGFAGGPEAEAARAAAALGTLLVAPAGAQGAAAGPYGVVAAPAAAADAVAVAGTGAAIPARAELRLGDAVRVRDAAVLASARWPADLRASAPLDAIDAPALARSQQLAGRLAIVRLAPGQDPAAPATAAAAAGAAAVLLADPRDQAVLPAVPLGRVSVPVLGVTGEAARAALAARPGLPARVAAVEARAGRGDGAVARRAEPAALPWSSAGPAFDATAKPDLAADGEARVPVPGSAAATLTGASVAAARVAARAAAIEADEPDLPPDRLAARLRRSVRPLGAPAGVTGAGALTAEPPALTFAPAGPLALTAAPAGQPWQATRTLIVANSGSEPLMVRLSAAIDTPAPPGVTATVKPDAAALAPGAERELTLTVSATQPIAGTTVLTGRLVGTPGGSIAWNIAVGQPGPPRLGALELVRAGERVTGVRFALGAFARGDAALGAPTRLEPVSRLELTLVGARDKTVVQRLTPADGARDLLPARYQYVLSEQDLERLPAASYAFRARARAPRAARAATAISPSFTVK